MKKPLILLIALLLIVFSFSACSEDNNADDDILPPSIMVNGETYYCFGYDAGLVPSEDDICGTIKSMRKRASDTLEIPSENDQSNFPVCLDQPYAVKDGKVYLFWSNEWHVCTPAGDEVWENEVCYPMVMIDDALYYCFNDKADIVLSEDDISGTVSSVCCYGGWLSMPIEDDQSNFTDCLNEPYAVIDGNVYLHMDGKWIICEVPTK